MHIGFIVHHNVEIINYIRRNSLVNNLEMVSVEFNEAKAFLSIKQTCCTQKMLTEENKHPPLPPTPRA